MAIYDHGVVNGSPFIATEFIEGRNLHDLMRKAWNSGQWIARPLAIRIVISCCEALRHVHSRTDKAGRSLKLVHQSICPRAILVRFDGIVKLGEFGWATSTEYPEPLDQSDYIYMAPERSSSLEGGSARIAVDHRADIFSLGIILYELFTGVRPLKRETSIASWKAAVSCEIEPPDAVSDISPDSNTILMRALCKNPDERYPTALEFESALTEFMVSQRWMATAVQLSESMLAQFGDDQGSKSPIETP